MVAAAAAAVLSVRALETVAAFGFKWPTGKIARKKVEVKRRKAFRRKDYGRKRLYRSGATAI